MTQSNFDREEQTDLGYGQLLAVLWRRRFVFLGIFLTVLPVAAILALRKEPTYQSSMQFLIEPNYQVEKGGLVTEFTKNTVQVDYSTQLTLMRSSEILEKALVKLKSEFPTISVAELKAPLTLEQIKTGEATTKVIQITYTSGDPRKTQKVLEALQKVYQEYNLEQQAKRLSDGLSFIDQQLPKARQSLLQAENSLKRFRVSNSLINPEAEANAIVGQLRSIEQERNALATQLRENQARYSQLQAQLGQPLQESLLISTRLSQSPRYQALLNGIQQIDLALAQQRVQWTDTAPVVQDLLEQRQNFQELLQQEAARVLGPSWGRLNRSSLDQQGQLVSLDLDLVNQLLVTQLTLLSLQTRDQSLAKTEQLLRGEIRRFPLLISEYNSLFQETQVKRSTLEQLLRARQELGIELNRGGFNWQVVESPQLGSQIGPNLTKDLLLGGVVALFLAGIAAFVREAADDAVRSSDQLKREISLPLLGATPNCLQPEASGLHLPWRSPLNAGASNWRIVLWQPFRESLDLIYKNIQLLDSRFLPKSLVVTSALKGEGKTTLVLGLALSAARLHQRVLVIDANLRSPTWHEQFEIPNEEGLSTLLSDNKRRAMPHTLSLSGSDIDVLTAGPIPQDSVRLLGSRRMEGLLQEFEQDYDLVLLDTPAVLGVVDAIQVGSCAKAVVLVARLERVTQSELIQTKVMLSTLNLIGIIANGTKENISRSPVLTELNHNFLHSVGVAKISQQN